MNYQRAIYFGGGEYFTIIAWYDDVTLVIPGGGAHLFDPEGARNLARALLEAADAADAALAENARVERIMATPDPANGELK